MAEQNYFNQEIVADVSRWQGKINWDTFASAGYKGKYFLAAFIRAGVSWGYTDAWFARNWAEVLRIGTPRSAYHVVYPLENAIKQMDFLFSVLGSDLGELPITLDCELDHGGGYKQIAATVAKCVEIIKDRTGQTPILYSRANWINSYIVGAENGIANPAPAWLKKLPLFLAQYLISGEEHPGPVSIPWGCSRDKAILHQTTAKADGIALGYESKEADISRVLNLPLFQSLITAGKDPEEKPLPGCKDCPVLERADNAIRVISCECEKYMLAR